MFLLDFKFMVHLSDIIIEPWCPIQHDDFSMKYDTINLHVWKISSRIYFYLWHVSVGADVRLFRQIPPKPCSRRYILRADSAVG